MSRHIGVQRESENGDVLELFAVDGAPPELLDFALPSSLCLRFVDPYGDTVFNQIQLPLLIAEVREIRDRAGRPDLVGRLSTLITFLESSCDAHVLVRFVGD